jgi:hypothetical protein
MIWYFTKQFYFNVLLGIDQFANILMLGSPDETISSRTGRAYLSGRGKWFVYPLKAFVDRMAIILAGQHDHCLNSIEPDITFVNYELWSWIKG